MSPPCVLLAERVWHHLSPGYSCLRSKTETAKLILRYLAFLSSGAGSLEARVVATNPVLEGMGNARTLRNNNSSRFGKWICLDFDESQALHLASIRTTLLEKVRCVARAPGERGFHVFYETLVDASDEALLRLSVATKGGHRDHSVDTDKRRARIDAIAACGVSDDVSVRLFESLRGLAQLGVLEFETSLSDVEGGCHVAAASQPFLEAGVQRLFPTSKAARAAVEPAMLERKLSVGAQTLIVKSSPAAAYRARDALIKAAYSQLFDAVVCACNLALGNNGPPSSAERAAMATTVGILDIFGFESYDDLAGASAADNSLEQLLINYANERLQRHFVESVFESEKREYEAEQVPCADWADFGGDNAATLAVLDASKHALLATLDEECILKSRAAMMSTSRSSDEAGTSADDDDEEVVTARALVRRFKTRLESLGDKFSCDAVHERDGLFAIVHFAGRVAYSARELVVKNMDAVPASIAALLPLPICAQLGAFSVERPLPSASGLRAQAEKKRASSRLEIETVCSRFRGDLNELSRDISGTTPHFVRCLKPNDDTRPDVFDRLRLVAQLRYCGVLEAVRVARAGYAVRLPHAAFADRYVASIKPAYRVDARAKVFALHRRLGTRRRRRSTATLSKHDDDEEEDDDDAIDQAALAKLDKNVKLASEAAQSVVEALQASYANAVTISCVAVGKSKVFMRRRAYDTLEKGLANRRREAAIIVAAAWRGMEVRRFFVAARSAQVAIAAVARGVVACRLRSRLARNVTATQALARAFLARRRGRRTLKAALMLTTVARRVLAIAARRRAVASARADTETAYARAVILVQAFTRSIAPRRFFLGAQGGARSIAVAIAAGRCSPPVSGLELSSRAAQHEAHLEAAVLSRDFGAASREQLSLTALRALLSRVWAGLTSSLLDDALLVEAEAAKIEIQTNANSAVKPASYDDMAAIDARATRADEARLQSCPTRSTLERAAETADTELKLAMQRRDFAKCAELQPRAERLRVLIENADQNLLVAESNDRDRASIVEAVEEFSAKLESALAARDFDDCAKLEARLEKAKTALADLDADPEPRLVAARAARAAAVAARDWRKAGRAQAEVRRWERRLNEKSAEPPVSSTPPKLAPQRSFGRKPASTSRCASVPPPRLASTTHLKQQQSVPSAALNVIDHTKRDAPPPHTVVATAVDSLPSITSRGPPSEIGSSKPAAVEASGIQMKSTGRTVAKLRPDKPVIAMSSSNIVEVSAAIAAKRTDCALVMAGVEVAGIVTDSDVTRAVAQGLNPSATHVTEIMTVQPKSVQATDSALEVLKVMVEHRFRHTPVLDNKGELCGVLRVNKLLYEAIDKIELLENKSEPAPGSTASQKAADMLAKMASTRAKNRDIGAALKPLLELLSGGDGAPTLRSLVSDREPELIEQSSSVFEAAKLIAETKRAALAVDRTKCLTGILSSKDVLSRVVARQLDPKTVTVENAMTASPDTVSPDATLLDALRQMHDGHYLHLPVVDEESGSVLGVVDALQIANATMGDGHQDGWSTLMCVVADDEDRVSEAATSVGNTVTATGKLLPPRSARSVSSKQKQQAQPPLPQRPVEKLRPEKPLVVVSGEPIASVCDRMIARRTDCALVIAANGSLLGIVTDHDIAKLAVIEFRDELDSRPVDDIMTARPKCILRGDGALDALKIMVAERLRHLPVLDAAGAVTGVLHISRVLYEAIDKIEKLRKSGDGADGSVTSESVSKRMADAVLASLKTSKKSASAQQIARAIGPLLDSLTKQTATTLRQLLEHKSRRDCLVPMSASVLDAAHTIAATGRAVLAISLAHTDSGHELRGILTPKDILSRVVAKRMPIADTKVESVMTAFPDTINADATLLEAMQQMHDHRYLHLPVLDEDRVLGVIDVTELALATMGGDASEGWSTLALYDADEDVSDIGSTHSTIPPPSSRGRKAATPTANSVRRDPPLQPTSSSIAEEDQRTVKQLRPDKHPVVCSSDESIAAVCAAVSARRTDCALLTSPASGTLVGIVTDNDVARKGIAMDLDLAATPVEAIMTSTPKVVSSDEHAFDALKIMVENRFRHLPVVDGSSIVGMLSVHRCLHAAVAKLERLEEATGGSGETRDVEAIVSAVAKQAHGGSAAKNVAAMLGTLMESLMGSSAKTLRAILSETRSDCLVAQDSTAFDAATVMAATKRAVLATGRDDTVAGILTAKDLMNRIVVRGLDPKTTTVEEAMTPSPDTISPDATLLEALHMMHDNKYLHLPVVEADGSVVGIVDVMELVYETMGGGNDGGDGWSTLLQAAAADEDRSDTLSVNSLARDQRGEFRALSPFESLFTYKITQETTGHVHRVQASDEHFDLLLGAVKTKLGDGDFALTYQDEDGDAIVLTDDQSLAEAVAQARSCGQNALKITCAVVNETSPSTNGAAPPTSPSTNSTLIVSLTLTALVAVVVISSLSRRS